MAGSHRPALKQLFTDAIRKHPGDREEFLDSACGSDAALRAELCSLLAAHDAAGRFLETDAHGSASRPPLDNAGRHLGPYEILSLVGTGGMGDVYRARDPKLNRVIAIKVLPQTSAANPEHRARFEREAQSIAALSHPNIVTIYSVEEAEGLLFLTMEYVDGKPLSDLIGKGGLPFNQILTCAIPLADAISAAHEKGITHRDLKPANVMLSTDGRVKVLDFGIAKLVEASARETAMPGRPTSTLTEEGRILGTVEYMSPEQAEGKPVDSRSDVFSLGIMLYEMATGERPFTGETRLSVLSAIVKDTPRSITDLNPAMPREFTRVVKRCLAKERERRYQNALDVRNELEELRTEFTSGAITPAAMPAAIRTTLKKPIKAALIGIVKLRNALGDSADTPFFAETNPRRGFRFTGQVASNTEVVATPAPTANNSSEATAVQSHLPRRVPLPGLAFAAVVLVGLIAVLLGLNVAHLRDRLLVRGSPPPIRSIAVLPLENLTGDRSQEYFADGMTDALITQLAQVGVLEVISRTSVVQYKGDKRPLQTIARELNVDGVVEGAVVRSGSRVRISAQLVDARNGRALWARSYERDLNDIVALQAEVAQAIVEAVVGKLSPLQRARLADSRPINSEATELFFGGVGAASRGSYQGFSDAITYFERAIAKQPDFALAYAAMSLCYIQFSYVGPLSPQEFMPKAEAAARKALELDEELAEAHAALGAVLYRYHWDWSAAEREYRRALVLNPNYSEGHWSFAEFLSASGRAEEALAEAQRAREVDPLSLQATLSLAGSFRENGNYERAIVEFRKALDMDPNRPRAHFQLGITYVQEGDLRAGAAELETAVNLSQGNQRFLAYLGYADAASGKRREAQEILSKLNSLSQRQYVSPVGIAAIHMGLGEREKALAWLDKAYQVHDGGLTGIATDHRLDVLHSDPRFQDLLQRVGLAR